MKLSSLSLASASLVFASSTVAFVNQPVSTFGRVGTSWRGSAGSAVFAKGAASHEEDLDLTRKVILDRMGMGGPAKVEEAPAPAPAPAKKKKEVEAAASKEE
jgi:hypothetical protein